jgi:hypothetical protein
MWRGKLEYFHNETLTKIFQDSIDDTMVSEVMEKI